MPMFGSVVPLAINCIPKDVRSEYTEVEVTSLFDSTTFAEQLVLFGLRKSALFYSM